VIRFAIFCMPSITILASVAFTRTSISEFVIMSNTRLSRRVICASG